MKKDVKPLTIQSHKSSGVSVELSSPDKNDPLKLKSLLKRKIGNKAVIVKTTSGPFIAEPIKIRDDKRPRLTFTE
jgi:hypothetical protein